MTAAGRRSTARSTVAGSVAQDWKPTPQGLSAPAETISSCWSSQPSSSRPPPTRPRPPALDTAAASAPPDAPPMGASAMGYCNEKNSVNAVRNAMSP